MPASAAHRAAEREFSLDLITTAPSVIFQVHLTDGSTLEMHNPADMPDPVKIDRIEEPWIQGTILVPDEYLGAVLKLCQDRRGRQKNLTYAGSRAMLVYELPLNEVVFDFYDRLKSISRGYASFDYQMTGYEEGDLVKMSILVNGEPVDALSVIVHRSRAEARGRVMCEKLKELIPRHLFQIPIQTALAPCCILGAGPNVGIHPFLAVLCLKDESTLVSGMRKDEVSLGKPRWQEGNVVGPWRLKAFLGGGGNAEVWVASRDEGGPVALKILNRRKRDAEPFKRFMAEIEALRRIGNMPGVLPLIGASLPDDVNTTGPAWLAMPIASPLRSELLARSTLEASVTAIAEVAETLGALAKKGIHHRDIKPDNLYFYEGRACIGDFGLVDYPEKEELTVEGGKLGPMFFMAPEMLQNPTSAESGAADVYSLAKTLWVLATGQNWPPPGQLRLDEEALRLSTFVYHQRAYLLDRIMERATAHVPRNRPAMIELAHELRLWVNPNRDASSSPDLSDVAVRINAATAPALRALQSVMKMRDLAIELDEIVRREFEPIPAALRSSGINHAVERQSSIIDYCGYGELHDGGKRICQLGSCFVTCKPATSICLWGGIGLETYDNGKIHMVAAHVMASDHGSGRIIWREDAQVAVGSLDANNQARKMCLDLLTNLPLALQAFAQAIGAPG